MKFRLLNIQISPASLRQSFTSVFNWKNTLDPPTKFMIAIIYPVQ